MGFRVWGLGFRFEIFLKAQGLEFRGIRCSDIPSAMESQLEKNMVSKMARGVKGVEHSRHYMDNILAGLLCLPLYPAFW